MLWWQNLKYIMCYIIKAKQTNKKLLTTDDELVLSAGFGILISFQQSPLEELFVGT